MARLTGSGASVYRRCPRSIASPISLLQTSSTRTTSIFLIWSLSLRLRLSIWPYQEGQSSSHSSKTKKESKSILSLPGRHLLLLIAFMEVAVSQQKCSAWDWILKLRCHVILKLCLVLSHDAGMRTGMSSMTSTRSSFDSRFVPSTASPSRTSTTTSPSKYTCRGQCSTKLKFVDIFCSFTFVLHVYAVTSYVEIHHC